MAAYGALVSLINDLDLIPNHPTHSFSFDNDQITSLYQTVNFLANFMDRYDSHGYNREVAEDLERKISFVAHVAHDVMESQIVDQIHAGSTLPPRPPKGRTSYILDSIKRKMKQLGSTPTQKGKTSYILRSIKRKAKQFGPTQCGKQRLYFYDDLQRAIEEMELVKRQATQLIEESGLTMEQPGYSAPPTSTSPLRMQFKAKSGVKVEQPAYSAPSASSEPLTSGKNLIVGFDAVADRLLNMLTGEPCNQRVVIPIVGMGGIGKTTLVKCVYDSLLIKQHFDVCRWATISYDYTVSTTLAELLYGGNVELHKELYGRRYLVVLDDMWNLKAWDEVQMYLPDNENGSRVVVTTRISYLATHLSPSSPFEMNFLDEDKSWELFCAKAFGREDTPIELEKIGKKIVRKCRGLPLSIVVIGGHLRRSSRAIEYWDKISNSMNPISSSGAKVECFEILSLSYRHLPPCLKPCFLYMGVFKEDEQINVSKLLRIWVAEGFVRANTGQTLEKVAEDYLNDLVERNLILAVKRRWNGRVESCVIHDILRELCLKIAKKEMFMGVLGTTEATGKERRIVIPQGSLDLDVVDVLKSAPLVRSLRCQGIQSFDELSIDFGSPKLLRVSANVNNMLLKGDEICIMAAHSRQVNLRYLAFSSKKLSTTEHFKEKPYIPSSISLFWNMQSIDVKNFDEQISAPNEIWEMSQLKHLELRGFYLPDPLPRDRSSQQKCIVLENLQTLVGVENFRLTEEACRRMPNIKELSVFYDRFPVDCKASSYYCPHNLGRFSKLESLKCEFGDDSMFPQDSKWRDVVRNFTFPGSLEELCLFNSNIYWENLRGMIKSLPNLRSFKIDSVQGTEWDLDDQEFPGLKELWMSKCHELVHWNANNSNFPVLEILHVWTMPNLMEIPFDIGDIPTLGLIELYHCSVSAAISAMKLVAEQESCGNMDIQLELHFCKTGELDSFLKIVDEEGLTITSLQLY